jgi:hypothetical protein
MTPAALRHLTVWQCVRHPLDVVRAVLMLVREHDSCTHQLADLRTECEVLRHEHGKLVMFTRMYANVVTKGGN